MNNNQPKLALLRRVYANRSGVFGGLLIAALLAFELFNYSTTEFALGDILGDLSFAGLRWATLLSVAFCGIDFAGIARLFTPEQGADEPAEVWYLFGAWVLAAAMNASLTWWGVAVAISQHTPAGSAIIGREMLTQIVPVFVAIMVWVIRILIIGTFSMAGERMFTLVAKAPAPTSYQPVASRLAQRPIRPVRPLDENSLENNLETSGD